MITTQPNVDMYALPLLPPLLAELSKQSTAFYHELRRQGLPNDLRRTLTRAHHQRLAHRLLGQRPAGYREPETCAATLGTYYWHVHRELGNVGLGDFLPVPDLAAQLVADLQAQILAHHEWEPPVPDGT